MSTKRKNNINFTEQIREAEEIYNRHVKRFKKKKRITKLIRIDDRLHGWIKIGAKNSELKTMTKFLESFLWPHYYRSKSKKRATCKI